MNNQNKPLQGLEDKLNSLISGVIGVPANEITMKLIHEQRERKIYPSAEPTISSKKGGYVKDHLKVFSLDEISDVQAINRAKESHFGLGKSEAIL